MSILHDKHYFIITATVCSVAGLFVYFVLSSLLISDRITIPTSIAISILIFALIKYYSLVTDDFTKSIGYANLKNNPDDGSDVMEKKEDGNLVIFLFVTIFALLILISYIGNNPDSRVFSNWSNIGVYGLIKLVSAIILCFFIPGYGMVLILSKKYKIDPILSVLLAYLLSILITGLTSYISALSFGHAISEGNYMFVSVYVGILICVFIRYGTNLISLKSKLQTRYYSILQKGSKIILKYFKYPTNRIPELLVFGSLFAMIVISTYVLFGGITIGDQWYHQGRALLFMSGAIREAVVSGAEGNYYPPFQSALLAALTSLSGLPVVNTYASIAFLNAMPMFAFYYFFKSWIPIYMRKAAPLAVSLFTLSSGFGWLYLLGLLSTQQILSPHDSISALKNIGHLDILSASNFVIPTAPDFSTGLIYIGLPAGFVLLAVLQTRIHTNGFVNISVIVAISVLGIISHYEYYIFILIASVLPPIFKMKSKDFIYISILIAISIVFAIDSTVPGNFYTSLKVLGYPLIYITAVFVTVMWGIYFVGEHLPLFLKKRLSSSKIGNIRLHNSRFNIISGVFIVFFISYLYLLSFVVLEQLSLNVTKDHAANATVPWYQYPIRLGVAGIFGIAFVLSYIFKRFEKEIFIFAVIVIFAFILGPYYSESRFSKYIMIGVIGFASLMIYKILNWRSSNHRIRNILILGTIIPFSGLSVLIFMGFNSLILQTHDYIDTLPRRDFPSSSELSLLETLRHMVNVESSNYNVVSFPNEYDRWKDGFMAKVTSFAGLPYDKIRESPLTLNASTIDSLYRHLDYSNSRYILVPKNNIKFENSFTQPTRFATDYFKRVYEDSHFIIVEVPPIHAPNDSLGTDIALVYSNPGLSSNGDLNSRLLSYDNATFNFKAKNPPVIVQQDNKIQEIILSSPYTSNETIFWSKNMNQTIDGNAMEVRFSADKGNESKDNNHVGLRWIEDDIKYYIKLSKNGLELFQKPNDYQQYVILSRNTEIVKEDNIWYTLRIESVNNLIKIFVNNLQKIQVSKPLELDNHDSISKIGLVTLHNTVKFKPIKIWNVLPQYDESNENFKYYNYYFPLNILALSESNYDVFRDNDLAIFSKKAIFISDSLKPDNSTLNRYLEYLHSGGIVVVISQGNTFNGTFSKQFSLESNASNIQPFIKIGTMNQSLSINVPGQVNTIVMNQKSDEKTIASYMNYNNESIAPFAIEKAYPNGGKIILINAKGYFTTISNSHEYFYSLSNIFKLLGIEADKIQEDKNMASPMPGFIGDMETSGRVTINSSSFSFPDGDNYPQIKAAYIKIFNKTGLSNISIGGQIIKDLKISGLADISISSVGKIELPGMISEDNYASMKIPNGFNMTIDLHPRRLGFVEVVLENSSVTNYFKIKNDSKIEFYNISSRTTLNSIPVLVKNPEIMAMGHTTLKNAVLDGYLDERGALNKGTPFDFQGNLKTKIYFVDHYNQPYKHGTLTQYIVYLKSITMNGTVSQQEDLLKIPGDISEFAKMKGEYIHLGKIAGSSINIIILSVLLTTTFVVILSLRMKYPRFMT